MSNICSPTKVLEELKELAGKVIGQYGSDEWEKDFDAGLREWGVQRRLDYSTKHKLDTVEISQIFRDEHHVERMLSIMKNLTKSVEEIHHGLKSQMKSLASKLSKGLSSLPDDILSIIFEFSNPPGKGIQQAVWFSHVCRRFRRVSFGTCQLWTTLHSEASKEELDTLILRSGPKSDLTVDLTFPHAGELEGIYSFMDDICVPHAPRWRKLMIYSGSDESEDPEEPETVDDMMRGMFARYNRLDLPLLEEIRIVQRRWDFDNDSDSWTTERFTPSWKMPNLKSITCDEYIPLPSSTYSFLRSFSTSFSLATEEYPARFTDLLAFLDSATGVVELDIAIRMLITRSQTVQLVQMTCDSLTTFSLQLSNFTLLGAMDIMYCLTESLVMPNLATLSVSLELRYDDILEDAVDVLETGYVGRLIKYSIPDHTTHTNLTSFNLELTHTEQTRSWGEYDVRHKEATIPLYKIPHVSSISVKMFCKLEFQNSPLVQFDWDQKFALRELRLYDCTSYDMEMLKETLESLEGRVWDTLESFTLDRCFHDDDYEEILKEVGEERLRFIPIPRTKFST